MDVKLPFGWDREYADPVFGMISRHSGNIVDASAELGVSYTAVAGAMAEEYNAWMGPFDYVWQKLPETLFVRNRSHKDIADQYDTWVSLGRPRPELKDKIHSEWKAIAADIGVANINLNSGDSILN